MAIRLAADLASKKALEEIKSPTGGSSSRQRIREILQKQREDQEKRVEEDRAVEQKAGSAFDPTNRKLLWVFR